MIVLVADTPACARELIELLKLKGHSVSIPASGSEALELRGKA